MNQNLYIITKQKNTTITNQQATFTIMFTKKNKMPLRQRNATGQPQANPNWFQAKIKPSYNLMCGKHLQKTGRTTPRML